jgi:hypothetical protein
MPLELVRIDPDRYPLEVMPCLRCGTEVPMRFAGPCERCSSELRLAAARTERRDLDAEYVPKVNVTANAVTAKDD